MPLTLLRAGVKKLISKIYILKEFLNGTGKENG